jgi:hypothetical protein
MSKFSFIEHKPLSFMQMIWLCTPTDQPSYNYPQTPSNALIPPLLWCNELFWIHIQFRQPRNTATELK